MSFPEEPGNGNETDFRFNGSLPVYNASRESYGNFSDSIPNEDYFFGNFSYPGTIKVCAFFSFVLLCVVPESLPSANGVAKVMFSFVSVCLSVHRVGNHVTINRDVFDLIKRDRSQTRSKLFNMDLNVQKPFPLARVQGPPTEPHALPLPPDMFKRVQYATCTVGKHVVGILLECFLMFIFIYST